MRAASDRIRSCTTAAELKSNVAGCLHCPRARGIPPTDRPTVPSGFTRYRLSFDCSAVTFYFQQRAVAGRSPANLITISLCSFRDMSFACTSSKRRSTNVFLFSSTSRPSCSMSIPIRNRQCGIVFNRAFTCIPIFFGPF